MNAITSVPRSRRSAASGCAAVRPARVDEDRTALALEREVWQVDAGALEHQSGHLPRSERHHRAHAVA